MDLTYFEVREALILAFANQNYKRVQELKASVWFNEAVKEIENNTEGFKYIDVV